MTSVARATGLRFRGITRDQDATKLGEGAEIEEDFEGIEGTILAILYSATLFLNKYSTL
jgi:hypothetical protein